MNIRNKRDVFISGGNVKFMGGAVGPMARSLLTKLVPTEDTGKVFSVVTTLEMICALGGSAVYTVIYNSTLATFPAAFNFITASIYVVQLILIT